VSFISKLAVLDLQEYHPSFKTKEWRVPRQIIESTKEIQSYFIRGFADSEGSVRVRKRNTELILCSGNSDGLKDIGYMLTNTFGINAKFSKRKTGVCILTTSDYQSLLNFKEDINFTIERKKNILKYGLNNYKRKGLRKYPPAFKFHAMHLLQQGLDHREVARIMGTNYANIYDWEKEFLTQ